MAKGLKGFIEKTEHTFQEKKALRTFYPIVEAISTFLFTPDETTSSGTHIRDGINLKRTMFLVILAMVPCLLLGTWNIGYQHALATGIDSDLWANLLYGAIRVIPLIIVSYGVGLGTEMIFAYVRKEPIMEGYLVSGMLIPLIMPPDVPLWMLAVAVVFAVIFVKEVFGGTGMNIFNVALMARAFLFFAYPTELSGSSVWISLDGSSPVDGYTGETLLAQAITLGSDFYNSAGVDYSSTAASFMDAFWGFIPGSVGETSTFACLIGAAILIYTGVGSWQIIVSVFAGGYVMAMLFNLWGANSFMEVAPHMQLVMGGFAFGAVFMATDPVTASQTPRGKYIYGFLIGMLAILIRVFNPAYPEGMMLAILFMNMMAPLVDYYVVQGNIKNRMKRLARAK